MKMETLMVKDRLEEMTAGNKNQEFFALRQITQELILYHLSQTDFFEKAAFMGGTCLRLFHNLDRFSEDMDFSLLQPDPAFTWNRYLSSLCDVLSQFGYQAVLKDKPILDKTVKKVFVKDNTIGKLLQLSYTRNTDKSQTVNIKLEIDTNSPQGAIVQSTPLLFPTSGNISTLELGSLFAGKIHALLCREYTKGRDWYDFLWYTARIDVKLNYELLQHSLDQMGPWQGTKPSIDRLWILRELENRIDTIDWQEAKRDIIRFALSSFQVESIKKWENATFKSRLSRIPERQFH
ncbi:nucleotidyl transferase AbiEii/AbiGii toxin family protein [uncultured Sphaerochaeta sp.]|uniref:nucleotidyl transferase AbiEii/AbiGii toxin family protein n=1 Tax=uncultured Sphaerochaeta sp. TaxID=886478 RepID=UPI002A0A1900|nr:nucleotidyl transferase AbiEii/AbiGii toxin family protein [uncultured Sphaerochaeta sp.]